MNWQKKLAQGFTSTEELLRFLELPVTQGSSLAEQEFPSRIPLSYAQRMQKGNSNDPLLLQVLAKQEELEDRGYVADPLEELSSNPLKGLIHKYYGRVLLTITGVCAVNCRYCFRRHFPYKENNPGREGWIEITDYIAKDSTITEVILSGGEPLLASDLVLNELIKRLETIPHVHTLRFHTRIPIVFPERIDSGLIQLLENTSLNKVIVLHCNHPQELNEEVSKACRELIQAGCHLLNQSVLLRGINDDAKILASLSQGLFSFGVMPYYLHVLDRVKGAAHFDISDDRAHSIYKELQTLLPGYLVPRLAREEAGKPNKTLLLE